MKYLVIIGLFFTFVISSCQKEVIVLPSENERVMPTRGGDRDPDANDGDHGGITDPDNESEEDKIKNKKKKAR